MKNINTKLVLALLALVVGFCLVNKAAHGLRAFQSSQQAAFQASLTE